MLKQASKASERIQSTNSLTPSSHHGLKGRKGPALDTSLLGFSYGIMRPNRFERLRFRDAFGLRMLWSSGYLGDLVALDHASAESAAMAFSEIADAKRR